MWDGVVKMWSFPVCMTLSSWAFRIGVVFHYDGFWNLSRNGCTFWNICHNVLVKWLIVLPDWFLFLYSECGHYYSTVLLIAISFLLVFFLKCSFLLCILYCHQSFLSSSFSSHCDLSQLSVAVFAYWLLWNVWILFHECVVKTVLPALYNMVCFDLSLPAQWCFV